MYGTGLLPHGPLEHLRARSRRASSSPGTSEVALASLHMGEILDELPLRYTGFSTCFRREAGAAGKDTRGMFRVHQFNKVEMFVFVEPEQSWDEHERMLDLEETFLQALELPYRVVNVAAGDLGASAAKKYDIEAWFPFQERYREVTLVLEHDRLPGAPTRDPLPRASTGSRPRTRSTGRWSPTGRCSRSSRTSRATCRTC